MSATTTIVDMRAAAEAFVADPSEANEQRVRETSSAYGMSRRSIDLRVADLRSAARKTQGAPICQRCGGSGEYGHHGTCFDCGGTGREGGAR